MPHPMPPQPPGTPPTSAPSGRRAKTAAAPAFGFGVLFATLAAFAWCSLPVRETPCCAEPVAQRNHAADVHAITAGSVATVLALLLCGGSGLLLARRAVGRYLIALGALLPAALGSLAVVELLIPLTDALPLLAALAVTGRAVYTINCALSKSTGRWLAGTNTESVRG
jgi:hypothetical protein